MAPKFIISVVSALALSEFAHAAFCNSFSSGPVASGNYIRVANATLIVPDAPSNEAGLLSLWTGLGTSNGDLIQALVESYAGDQDTGCGVENDNWCAWASTLDSSGQQGGPQVLTNAGDYVTQSYIYNDDTQQYDQYVLINGVVVSTFSTTSGFASGWGTAEECNQNNCGTVPEHDWVDIVLIMDQQEADYSSTFGNTGSSGTLTTADGGTTWTSSQITINSCTYSGSS